MQSAAMALAAGMMILTRATGGPALADQPGPSEAAKAAVSACNRFGIDLYRAVSKERPDENLFLSPYSISVALAMTAEGARNQTEAEMARVMHFPEAGAGGRRGVSVLHTGYAELAEGFRLAAGNTDPAARKQIASLKAKLEAANREAERLQQDRKWSEASRAQSKAEDLAAELNKLLAAVDRFELRVANALWVDKGYPLLPLYVQTIDRFYGTGGVTPLDISGQTEPSRLRINRWVEDHTEHRIKDLITAGALVPDTRLVITNAVYFKGQWAAPFAEASTTEEDFATAGGKTNRVKMMQDRSRVLTPYAAFNGDGTFFETPRSVPKAPAKRPPTYPDDAGFSMISLAYKGGDLSMVLVAPRSAGGLGALEKQVTAENLQSWLSRIEARTVDTAVPRFTMESSHTMSRTLQGMGMQRAFSDPAQPGGAQFSGMTASEDPLQQLYIGSVLHKAWVDVNEKGTEAAAATAVLMRPTSAAPAEETVPFVPQFRADRPFLFVIRDARTGLVLFMGRVVDPAGL